MWALLDPPGWDQIPETVRAELKCGPGDGVLEALVPDTWRVGWPAYRPLCITPSCARHDAEYRWLASPSDEGRRRADRRFLRNMQRQIFNAGGPAWLLRYRLDLAHRYYHQVRLFGFQAFWGDRIARMRAAS
jgi:hypothetical protein